MAAIGFLGFLLLVLKGYPLERGALENGWEYGVTIAALSIALGAARWRTARRAQSEDSVLLFEEEQEPVIHGLGLYRDGALPVGGQQNR
jgi:hypothetical protein